MRKVISARRVHDTLLSRYVICADAAASYAALVQDAGPMSDTYRQMAATERCAASEVAHLMTLLGLDDPRRPAEADGCRRVGAGPRPDAPNTELEAINGRLA